MTADSDGFLGRWARRKAQSRSGAPLPPEPQSVPTVPAARSVPVPRPPVPATVQARATPAPDGLAADPAASSGSAGSAGSAGQAEPAPPAPTLQDAQQLTPASDFRPFVARAVAPEVRNAAFRQLFSDPHFNVMDGLDIYIDDYSKPDPLPLALARELLEAHFPTPPAVGPSAAGAAPQAVSAPVADAPGNTSAGAVDPAPEDPARAQPSSDPAP